MIPTVSSDDKESADKSNPLHSTKELFVGDLSSFCTENDLRNIFSNFGEVIFVEIKRGRHKESLLHGFVEMSNCSEATKALEAVNGMRFKGRKMRVNFTHLSNPPSLESLTWTHIQVNFISLNIEKEINEEYLQTTFAKFGTIGDSVVKRHSVIEEPSPHILGYAFIYFETASAAIDAISSMDNATVDDVRYECRFGPPKKEIQKNKKKKLKQERLEQHQQQHHALFTQTIGSRDPLTVEQISSELSFPPPPSPWEISKSSSKSAVAFSIPPSSSEIEYDVSRSLHNRHRYHQRDMSIPHVSSHEMLLSHDNTSNVPHRLIRTDHVPLSEALIEAAQKHHVGIMDPRTITNNSNNRHIVTNHARSDVPMRPSSQPSQPTLINNFTATKSVTSDNMYEYEPTQSNITLEQWQSFVQQRLHHQPSISTAKYFSEVQPHSSSSLDKPTMMARASPTTPFSISSAHQLVNHHDNRINLPHYSISSQRNSNVFPQAQRHSHRIQTTYDTTPIHANRKIIRAAATDPQLSAYSNPPYPHREPLRTSLYPSYQSTAHANTALSSLSLSDAFPISTTTTTASSQSSSSSSMSPFLVPPESPSILGSKSITRTASSASNSSSSSSSQPMVITPADTIYSFVDTNRHNKSHITLPRSLSSLPNTLSNNLESHNSNSSKNSTFPTFSSDAMASLSYHPSNNQIPAYSASLSTQQQSIAYPSTSPR